MPARTGKQYINGLREQEREVWLGGERVRDVTKHKGLAGGVRAIAGLYDMQHDAELHPVMTYPSPSSGEPVGRSFDTPTTQEGLETRSKMMLNWARSTCGMMGRSPDFMNVTFAAWGAAADFFGEKRPEFADNMRRYVEYIRENDITLTHALINLQRSRNASGMFNLEEGTALEVVRETGAGIVVRGARILATLGPLADEIAVYSPRLARHSEEHSPFAVNFSIPCSTKGLKFLCRDSFDLGRSHFDHPLGSRFDESDTVVIFDEDHDDRYPYLTTWLGEHQNESDMAFYSTPPFDHLVGPGIGRAEYGGFLMTLPPRRMIDVWSDPDYDFAQNKPERLLLAALDYSMQRYVVYVAAKPPRSVFRSIAAHLNRRIVYIPIGALNPAKMKKIRVVHVLDSYERRNQAKEFIW